jgi:hypothetical protein
MTEEYENGEPIYVDEMDDAERMPSPVATSAAAAVPKCEDKFYSWIMARDSASSPTLQGIKCSPQTSIVIERFLLHMV